MAVALLGVVSKTWAVGYLVGDLGLHFIYTLVRNDFIYWLPAKSLIASIVLSLIGRTLWKVRMGLEI